jgi:hypothetical protein
VAAAIAIFAIAAAAAAPLRVLLPPRLSQIFLQPAPMTYYCRSQLLLDVSVSCSFCGWTMLYQLFLLVHLAATADKLQCLLQGLQTKIRSLCEPDLT